MLALIVALSLLFVVGVAVATSPSDSSPAFARVAAARLLPGRRRRGGSGDRLAGGVAGRHLGGRVLASLIVAALVLTVSGWVVPAVIVGLGVFWATAAWQQRQRGNELEIARLDALASWIESVRDVLLAGEQPIGAITSTVSASTPLIRPHVRRLAAGLARQDPEIAFRRFADDVDDPLGDLVAAGLAIAIRRGGRAVPVLTALAQQTRQQVDRRRLVEAERAPTRREVRALTLIMGLLLLGLLLLGRSQYLAAYDEPAGQLFLGSALAGYAALLVRVQRLAAFPRPSRFLTAGVLGGVSLRGVSR